MRAKFYKTLTWFCALFGKLGDKIRFWAEFKEHMYWNDEQCKIIEIPEDIHIFIYYNRKGDFLKISAVRWPLVDGKYDNRDRPDVLRTSFTKEEIHKLTNKTEES